jgi:hypothetical protein
MEFNGFERWFAKVQFGFEQRTKFYQELSALLRAGMSKPDAINLLQTVASDEGKKEKDSMAVILSCILMIDSTDGAYTNVDAAAALHLGGLHLVVHLLGRHGGEGLAQRGVAAGADVAVVGETVGLVEAAGDELRARRHEAGDMEVLRGGRLIGHRASTASWASLPVFAQFSGVR